MRQKTGSQKPSAEHVIKDIRRATRKQYGAEEKIRIVLEGLRGEAKHRRTLPGVKVLPRAFTTPGRRNSSRLARSGWQVTQRDPPPPMK